jgi:hypothetical protein
MGQGCNLGVNDIEGGHGAHDREAEALVVCHLAARHLGWGSGLQGYLAHKKQPPPRTLQ